MEPLGISLLVVVLLLSLVNFAVLIRFLGAANHTAETLDTLQKNETAKMEQLGLLGKIDETLANSAKSITASTALDVQQILSVVEELQQATHTLQENTARTQWERLSSEIAEVRGVVGELQPVGSVVQQLNGEFRTLQDRVVEASTQDSSNELQQFRDNFEALNQAVHGLTPAKLDDIHRVHDHLNEVKDTILQAASQSGSPADVSQIRGELEELRRAVQEMSPAKLDDIYKVHDHLNEVREALLQATGSRTAPTEDGPHIQGQLEELRRVVQEMSPAKLDDIHKVHGHLDEVKETLLQTSHPQSTPVDDLSEIREQLQELRQAVQEMSPAKLDDIRELHGRLDEVKETVLHASSQLNNRLDDALRTWNERFAQFQERSQTPDHQTQVMAGSTSEPGTCEATPEEDSTCNFLAEPATSTTPYWLPEDFRVYIDPNTHAVGNNPLEGYEERTLPTVNRYTGEDGGYLAIYSHDASKAVYSVADDIYVVGQVRLKGHYAGRIFHPEGYENMDIGSLDEFKQLAREVFDIEGWAGGDTGAWFGLE